MNYAVYEEILTRRMITFGVLFGAATLVFALIVFCKIMYIRKKNKETGRWNIKRKLGFSGFFGIAMMCVSLGLGTKYTLECHYDIQNQAYIVWNGDFVMEHTGKSFFLYIPDEDGIQLESSIRALSSGKYTGIVIYGEKSKIALEIQVDEIGEQTEE